jgi:hypothetical protein
LFEPDWNDLSLYDDEVTAFDEKARPQNYLRRHWAGTLRCPFAIGQRRPALDRDRPSRESLTARRSAIGDHSDPGDRLLGYFAVATLVWIWSSVGIWRSAYWHRRRGGAYGGALRRGR